MVTIKLKLEEILAHLGKPCKLIMNNEFNNALINISKTEMNLF